MPHARTTAATGRARPLLGISRAGLALLAALVAASAPAAAPANAPMQGLARTLLKELVETNSTHGHGSTVVAAALAERFRAAGFPAEDVLLLAPADHPTKGNLVVRLHGRGAGRPLLYLCHLDVVEARREDWSLDPFTLTEQDGWLYGRGTIDMKGQDAAVAASLIAMKREGLVPDRDVVVAFTADEESGGDANGVDWLLTAHPELMQAALVVNPDGGEAGLKQGRRLYVAIQTSEKVVMNFTLLATDKGGHSSRPTAANPIYRIAAALERLSQLEFPLHLTDTTRLYFARRATLESGARQADMRAVGAGNLDPGAIRRLSADVETNIALRTTCTATLVDGGHAINALPQRAAATIQCRVIPGESPASVAATLAARVADPSISITPANTVQPSPESPPDAALVREVERVTTELWPGVIVLPEMSAGATDSRYTRPRGLPSYGIDGLFDDLDDGRAHGRDERIGVAAFGDEVEFTFRLMRRLAAAPRP